MRLPELIHHSVSDAPKDRTILELLIVPWEPNRARLLCWRDRPATDELVLRKPTVVAPPVLKSHVEDATRRSYTSPGVV